MSTRDLTAWPPESRKKLEAICRRRKPRRVSLSQGMSDVSAAYRRSGFAEVLAELSQAHAQATGLTDERTLLAYTLDDLGIPQAESLVERARLALSLGNRVMDDLQDEQYRAWAADARARRRARQLTTTVEPIRRLNILERDGATCYLGGTAVTATTFHLEHVIPLSRGGTHTADNVRIACEPCNLGKGALMLSELMR